MDRSAPSPYGFKQVVLIAMAAVKLPEALIRICISEITGRFSYRSAASALVPRVEIGEEENLELAAFTAYCLFSIIAL